VLTPEPTATQVEIPLSEVTKQSKQVESEPIIRHTLFEEEEETVVVPKPEKKAEAKTELAFEGYIETTELIKNIDVTYSEIDIHHLMEFEQVIINEIDVNDFEIVDHKQEAEVVREVKEEPVVEEPEDQMLMFDLPAVSSDDTAEAPKKKELDVEVATSSIEEIEVKDAIEVVPVTEVTGEGVKRYSLDDYQEMETMLNEAKPGDNEDEEVAFSTRTVESPDTDEKADDEPADPLNTPISKLLKDRTEERKKKMKEFNYKFRNSASKIEDIEKQPAYKRAGIDLDETKNSGDTNISRTSVNTDDDDIELRSNNSFLHDNVD
jgi:cell division protein FtsZ